MRFLFAITLLLSLSALFIAHRNVFFRDLQLREMVALAQALSGPEFAQVKPKLHYLDVELHGTVPTLPLREEARRRADAVPGLRCLERTNFLRIPAKLTGSLEEDTLHLAGWLQDESTLHEAVVWFSEARPGLEISADGVHLSQHVNAIPPPDPAGTVPPAFRQAWASVQVPASLKITRVPKSGMWEVHGFLPSSPLQQAVLDALPQEASENAELKTGRYVTAADFPEAAALTAFLGPFFATPGAESFRVERGQFHVRARVTPAMQAEWEPLLRQLAGKASLKTDFEVHASVFHFPDRRIESPLEPDALSALRTALAAAKTQFESLTSALTLEEAAKLTPAAEVLKAIGPQVRVIVGCHMDTVGDAKDNEAMAQRRAEHVISQLESLGVAPEVLEAAVFPPVPGASDRARRVELLVR